MAPPKAAQFLDVSDSEDERINDYGSDDEMKKGGRGAKRRKINSDDEFDSDDERDDQEKKDDDGDNDDGKAGGERSGAESGQEQGGEEEPSKTKSHARSKTKADHLPKVDGPITKKNLVATEAAIKKSGVVYLSRVPPFMKPNKLRSLLAPHGTINRIFLAPENPVARARRIKGGGNKRKTFTEGWVEFLDKKAAKTVCELLNTRPMGGKKGSYYRDDIWNLLYLKGFKWHNLTEQIAAEDAERSSRMRAEISKSTRENKLFVRNVERGKMLHGIEAKAKKRKVSAAVENEESREARQPAEPAEPTEKPTAEAAAATSRERSRTFRQVAQVNKEDQNASEQPEHVSRVLSKIF